MAKAVSLLFVIKIEISNLVPIVLIAFLLKKSRSPANEVDELSEKFDLNNGIKVKDTEEDAVILHKIAT